MTGSDTVPARVTGINHVTLVVADLPRSVWFYRDILGWNLRAQWARGAYLDAGGLWFCLELGQPDNRADDTHLAFSCAPEQFAALSQRIAAHAPKWKENRSEGESLYFLDPDGHKLELHAGDMASRLAYYRVNPPDGFREF
ncbi:VOC family protein [Roseinatronobacter alkalisoli]|uniref:VOC family protein n=1 Tax=Roseinatronobacter alkalisoli TaxID=3028235 RepID=A0ABT5T5X2_9RHOB|nr:VOC family protein [Roseinatronobacter sp. HJB301]MDD7970508.1 VOC family protein [Roseinatronobacter sp. HJB301]